MSVEKRIRDRSQCLKTSEPVSGPKTILVQVHDDDGFQDRIDLSLSLARRYGAHLQFLHVIPSGAYRVAYGMGTCACEIVSTLEERAGELQRQIETQLVAAEVSWEYERLTDDVKKALVLRAALVDLIVVGRDPRTREFGDAAATTVAYLLQNSSTPIWIAGGGTQALCSPAHAMIAWNGSVEVADTLRAALGLLRKADAVDLVCVGEGEEGLLDAGSALAYLSRNGVRARRVDRPQCFDDVADDLVDYAVAQEIGVIVMGGYSHNRTGEFLFGGVTRRLLLDCPVSLVLSR